MNANKIDAFYIIELMENIKIKSQCGVCENTLSELLKLANKEFKQTK